MQVITDQIDKSKPQASFVVTMSDGSQRRFVQRPKTAGVLAWARRVEHLYRRAEGLDKQTWVDEQGEPVLDESGNRQLQPTIILNLCDWVMLDKRLLNDFVHEIYEGDHTDIDWYEQDGESVLLMLYHFFSSRFGTERKKSAESSTSSQSTDTSSATANESGSATADGINSSTSNPDTSSPAEAPITTTS